MSGAGSIVFFGLDGAFSSIPLSFLAASGLRPSLVINGVEKPSHALRPLVEAHPAEPGLIDWVASKVGRGGTAPPGLVGVAHELGIDAIRTTDANCGPVRSAIAKRRPDALVIAGFPHLLKTRTLSLARAGGLNVHPGKLPEERGAAPLFWALKRGAERITVTVHVLDQFEDAGDVVASQEVAFEPGLSGQAVLKMAAEAAAPMLLKALRGLLDGDLIRTPQAKERVGRCPRPNFRDGQLDASMTARQVYTFVAGCAATYSLFAECGGDRFFVREAISYDETAELAFEYVLTGDRLLLRCSPGVVELQLKEEGALFSAEYTE